MKKIDIIKFFYYILGMLNFKNINKKVLDDILGEIEINITEQLHDPLFNDPTNVKITEFCVKELYGELNKKINDIIWFDDIETFYSFYGKDCKLVVSYFSINWVHYIFNILTKLFIHSDKPIETALMHNMYIVIGFTYKVLLNVFALHEDSNGDIILIKKPMLLKFNEADQLHSTDGPALMFTEGSKKHYYINGEEYSEEEWNEKVKR